MPKKAIASKNMTTFQAILQAILHTVTELLPLGGGETWTHLLRETLGWHAPNIAFQGILYFSIFMALIFFFRHDWASILSNLVSVILYRRLPSSLDERLSLFITLSILPALGARQYLKPFLPEAFFLPVVASALILVGAIPLALGKKLSRQNKGMFDWNPWDALWIGVGQTFYLIPGIGQQTGALSIGMLRNYTPEALIKYVFLSATPLFAIRALSRLQTFEFLSIEPVEGMSWLSVGASTLVAFATGVLLLGALAKQAQAKEYGKMVMIRLVLGTTGVIWFWLQTKK